MRVLAGDDVRVGVTDGAGAEAVEGEAVDDDWMRAWLGVDDRTGAALAPGVGDGAGRVESATGEQPTNAQARSNTTNLQLFINALTSIIRRQSGQFCSGRI